MNHPPRRALLAVLVIAPLALVGLASPLPAADDPLDWMVDLFRWIGGGDDDDARPVSPPLDLDSGGRDPLVPSGLPTNDPDTSGSGVPVPTLQSPIAIAAPTPEPGTIVLLTLGAAAIGVGASRKRRSPKTE